MPLILVLNAGSSSLKASVVDIGGNGAPGSTLAGAAPAAVASATVDWGSDATQVKDTDATVQRALQALWDLGVPADGLAGVGHRVVHGGSRFREPVIVDDVVLAEIAALSDLAPLHNAIALKTIRAQRGLLPGVQAVAAFDTAFHASLEPDAYVYPLPWEWYAERDVRRYGFHGLSVAWSVRRAAALLGTHRQDLNLVVAHLGSGCSVSAVRGGRSVSTSMGMTPLEGLMMGTRAGSFDPGIALRLLKDGVFDTQELAEKLEHASGLLGVSGVSGDIREVTRAALGGSERAALALQIFERRAAEGVAAAAVSLPRLDAIVFTGGIGTNAHEVRARIVARLAVLGIEPIEVGPNAPDAILSSTRAAVAVLSVAAREDIVIGEAVAALVEGWSNTQP